MTDLALYANPPVPWWLLAAVLAGSVGLLRLVSGCWSDPLIVTAAAAVVAFVPMLWQ